MGKELNQCSFFEFIFIMPESSSRSERRRSRRRQRLIDAAREIIARKGLAGLTVQDVTEEADMAVGSFYTYFPNKDALIEAAVWEDLEELRSLEGVLAEGYALETAPALRLRRIYEFFDKHRNLMQAVFGPDGSPEQFHRGMRLMEESLVEGLQEIWGLDEAHAAWIAPLLAGMLAGGLRYMLAHPEVSAEEMTLRTLSLLRPLTERMPLPDALEKD